MEYEIHIGEIYEINTQSKRPMQIIIISDEQKQIIEHFANTKRDENLNTIYIINQCEFRIFPHFKTT